MLNPRHSTDTSDMVPTCGPLEKFVPLRTLESGLRPRPHAGRSRWIETTNSAMRVINSIIVHHTHGHVGARYHYLVMPDGDIIRQWPISQPGRHTWRRNAHSVAVAYVGGPGDTRTPAQKQAMLQLLAKLVMMYRCRVSGHNNYSVGENCPGFNASTEYAGLYDQIVLGNGR